MDMAQQPNIFLYLEIIYVSDGNGDNVEVESTGDCAELDYEATVDVDIHSPADGSYLYFVARGDGSSQFSRSLKEHNKAVDYYQKNRKIRKMMRKKRLQEQSSRKL